MSGLEGYTIAQIHFVRGTINHRLRFGLPYKVLKLDAYRSLALFNQGQIFGYVRWRANDFGTQNWQVFILKAGAGELQTRVPGIYPAVKILAFANGKTRVKRILGHIDRVERDSTCGLEAIPHSYWQLVNHAVLTRGKLRDLPWPYCQGEEQNAV